MNKTSILLPNIGDIVKFTDVVWERHHGRDYFPERTVFGIVKSYRNGTLSFVVKTRRGYQWIDGRKLTIVKGA